MVKPGFSHFHMEKWHITIATRIPQELVARVSGEREFMYIDHCYETYKQMPTACPPDT